MTFKFLIYTGATWYDVSDYIDAASDVPFVSRNSDFTPRFEGFNFELAKTAEIEFEDVAYTAVDDLVKITDGNDVFLWGGYISKINYKFSKAVYEIEVGSTLNKLTKTLFGYDQMHATFAGGVGSQYWTDYASHNSVDFTWALECAFSVNGLTLDTDTVYSTFLFNKTSKTGWAGKSIYYSNLYFDENQLYCLGLSTAADPATVITEYVTRIEDASSGAILTSLIYKGNHEPEVNCADFIIEALTSLRLALKQTDVNSYQLVSLTSNYTIAENDKFDYKFTNIKAKNSDPGISGTDIDKPGDVWGITTSPRAKYYLSTETKLDEYKLGGKETINIMKNFTVYFPDADNQAVNFNESACVMELSSSLAMYSGSSDAKLNIAAMRYKAVCADIERVEAVTPHKNTFYTVIENYLSIDKLKPHSKIVQEN